MSSKPPDSLAGTSENVFSADIAVMEKKVRWTKAEEQRLGSLCHSSTHTRARALSWINRSVVGWLQLSLK